MKATYIGTVTFDFLDRSESNWKAIPMEDIVAERVISPPQNYLFTLGSGVNPFRTSLATTPSYQLPTNSQFYLAGRDVFRWGGTNDPYEIDFDRYGFTPDYAHGVAVVWKAPKSESHHLSMSPQLLNYVSNDWKEICEAILTEQLP